MSVLVSWAALLSVRVRSGRRHLALEVALRRQHYLQACARGTVLLYWGLALAAGLRPHPLIFAQLPFFAFDMLLVWSRRDVYVLGFGPWPVVFSISLFLHGSARTGSTCSSCWWRLGSRPRS